MGKFIDTELWQRALAKPDWYVGIAADFKRLEKLAAQSDHETRKQIKSEMYGFIETALKNKQIMLAKAGEDFDKQRRPIDTIVIHHSKNRDGLSLARLNAMHLLIIYGTYYAKPSDEREKHFTGQPVWSGHFYKNQQVFWGYHWLVKTSGQAEQILDDKYVGWHAGNWDINTRSIGICIDDDLSEKAPSPESLKAVAKIIKNRYAFVKPAKIIGHKDANPKTACPGKLFDDVWRKQLLSGL
ncbi:MAG: peptidoglycan recognition protein family protein [Candidatus Saccharimonadales bacterium]